MNEKYRHILHLPHPTSRTHPRMSLYARAAQFAPFAALSGHQGAIDETARCTYQKIELDENERSRLSAIISSRLHAEDSIPEMAFTVFVRDTAKDGGNYVRMECRVKKYDAASRTLITTDNSRIPVDDIIAVEDCPSD